MTKAEQKCDNIYPSERAILARTNGEVFNRKNGKFLIDLLRKEGIKAVAPGQSSFWENKKSEKYGFASTWSERHVAYISGLGTFSLTDALITPLGTAVRIGSVVVNALAKPTVRKYSKYNEYCLYYSKGTCMKCAKRCPVKLLIKMGMIKLCVENIKGILLQSILKMNIISNLTTAVYVYLEPLVSLVSLNKCLRSR
jgi:epoxyqueuosine reductase QueG